MATLCIDRPGTAIDFDRGAMTIREPDGKPRSVPLTMLDRVVIVGKVQVSARLLTRLAERGTGVTLMPGRGARRSCFLHGAGHGDVARRLGQFRLLDDITARTTWARRLLWFRLAGQHRLLGIALRARPDQRRALTGARATLRQAMKAVRGADCSLATLRGHEGAASAAYFRAYRQLFSPALGFAGRRRRPPPDPVNAALSLGYTLAHGDALKAIVASGLEPMFGIVHDVAYGRDSLACDLTELGREAVERLVWRLFADRVLEAGSFARDGCGVRLSKSGRAAFFAVYEHAAPVHRRWMAGAVRVFARECARLGDGVGQDEEVLTHGGA